MLDGRCPLGCVSTATVDVVVFETGAGETYVR